MAVDTSVNNAEQPILKLTSGALNRKDVTSFFPSTSLCFASSSNQLGNSLQEIKTHVLEHNNVQNKFVIFPENLKVLMQTSPLLKVVTELFESKGGLAYLARNMSSTLSVADCPHRPSTLLIDIFITSHDYPALFLSVIDSESSQLKEAQAYTAKTKKGIVHVIRKFSKENVHVVHGVISADSLTSGKIFQENIDVIRKKSSIFEIPDALEMNQRKVSSVIEAFLTGVSLISGVQFGLGDPSTQYFLTKEQFAVLSECIDNIGEVTISIGPSSGATTLLAELAHRISRSNKTIIVFEDDDHVQETMVILRDHSPRIDVMDMNRFTEKLRSGQLAGQCINTIIQSMSFVDVTHLRGHKWFFKSYKRGSIQTEESIESVMSNIAVPVTTVKRRFRWQFRKKGIRRVVADTGDSGVQSESESVKSLATTSSAGSVESGNVSDETDSAHSSSRPASTIFSDADSEELISSVEGSGDENVGEENVDKATFDDEGYTELYRACKTGDKLLVNSLLAKGTDANQNSIFGESPLHLSCRLGNTDIVRTLLCHKADVNARSDGSLFSPSADILTSYQERNTGVTQFGFTPLHISSEQGFVNIVDVLLHHKADVDALDTMEARPLHFACQEGHLDVACRLLSAGADVNSLQVLGSSPLHFASSNGFDKIVQVLLDHGANVNLKDKEGQTALHRCCSRGYSKVVEVFLKLSTPINEQDNNGKTPLHLACQSGREDAVEALLRYDVDGHVADNDRRTSLHLACHFGCLAIVKMLIKYSVSITAKDKLGLTPLHVACKSGHAEIVQTLLGENTAVDVVDNEGCTTLHLATVSGSLETVQILITTMQQCDNFDIDTFVSQKNKLGYTAYDIACNNKFCAIERYLSGIIGKA